MFYTTGVRSSTIVGEIELVGRRIPGQNQPSVARFWSCGDARTQGAPAVLPDGLLPLLDSSSQQPYAKTSHIESLLEGDQKIV
jgi:hypothetical protein